MAGRVVSSAEFDQNTEAIRAELKATGQPITIRDAGASDLIVQDYSAYRSQMGPLLQAPANPQSGDSKAG